MHRALLPLALTVTLGLAACGSGHEAQSVTAPETGAPSTTVDDPLPTPVPFETIVVFTDEAATGVVPGRPIIVRDEDGRSRPSWP